MDPESLLLAEVVGMIGIAGFLTLSLRGEEESSHSRWLRPGPVATTVFCPRWKCHGEVTIGVEGDGMESRLDILVCDLLLRGDSCDRDCVRAVARA